MDRSSFRRSGPPSLRPGSLAAAAVALAALLPCAARGQSLPKDFVAEPLIASWDRPTCIRFIDADDLLVAEKAGVLWDVRRGVRHAKPVVDLKDEILDNGDRGLLSVAIDPEFATNGWIYLLYIVDPAGDGSDSAGPSFGRLTRYTTAIDVNGDLLADPASRTVLIGASWPEGIPSIHLSHSVGDLRFSEDGSLFVSTGDGAHYDLTDLGGNDPGGFGTGKFDASEDVGAFRSQTVTSLAGKILRIDPATGLGLPDNPWFTGSAADNASRVWAMGLRNPFRFCIKPGTPSPGRLMISDVGWDTWEELDSCSGGENFGWPCREGPNRQPSYANADPYGDCANMSIFTNPIWTWSHTDPTRTGFVGQCSAGACYYTGGDYPQAYAGRIFYCDYASSWIRSIVFVNGKMTINDAFGDGFNGPIDLEPDPVNGDLWFISIGQNQVFRIRYTKANRPPVALATITPTWGASPLAVTLDASASYDPEGQTLVYDWDLGDGTHASTPVATDSYPVGQDYVVTLTVTDPSGAYGVLKQVISVDDTPPSITALNSPAPGSLYVVGQPISFDATVADAEDDPAGIPLAVKWTLDLVHEHHIHPGWATLTGAQAQYVPPVHGDSVYFHVTLTVTDSRGMTASQEFDLYDRDNVALPHLVSLSSLAPRFGKEVVATGHLHYPGLGTAELVFDWGDGTTQSFQTVHMQDRRPRHTYLGPGDYTVRLTARSGGRSETVEQKLFVRPVAPAVAIFAPLIAQHAMKASEQWEVATAIADDVHSLGFEAQLYGAGDQKALAAWLDDYMFDAPLDYLVCLDSGASVAYAGENNGSRAERWLDHGNGILWTGYNPFARYITKDLSDEYKRAGKYAADEVLDAATPKLCSGSAHMKRGPDHAEVPDLVAFDATRALVTANLAPSWTIEKLYATDGGTPPISDALVIQNPNGGEYAQFYCVNDASLPRASVLKEFLRAHLFTGLQGGPASCDLLEPTQHATEPDPDVTLTWAADPAAKSWLVEVAADETFDTPVFTTTVARGTVPMKTGSVDVRLGAFAWNHYWWRVTARDDVGFLRSKTRDFTILADGRRLHLGR
jgi:glucose/arabinose dehydrogenase